MIYADNAATTKLDIDAFEAMKPFLLEDYSNPSQLYSFSRNSKKAMKEARCVIAKCINASSEEIFFTSGGTESDNWAIKGTAFAAEKRRAIITSSFEHHAVLRSCYSVEELSYPVAYLPIQSDGTVSDITLNSFISDNTNLVSIMYANNELGTIQPIKKLCEIAHSHGALFHTDAVQAVGHVPIDVKDLDVDLLSASAHKFNGPKGIGFLYIKNGTSIHQLLSGGSQEFAHRAGTENVASIVGMATALKKNCDLLEKNTAHVHAVTKEFLSHLECDYHINSNTINQLPGLLSVAFDGVDGEALLHLLDLKGICISTGSACDSKRTQISHVLKAINSPENLAKSTVRFSFGKSNTVEEAIIIANTINDLIAKSHK